MSKYVKISRENILGVIVVKKIEIDSTVMIKDYRKLVYFNSIGRKKSRKYTLVGLLTIAFVYLIYSLVKFKGLDLIAGAGLGYISFIGISAILLERNIVKFSKEEDTLIGKSQNVIIRDNGVKVSNHIKPDGENYAWNVVLNAYETKNYFYLYMTNGQIVVISKSNINDNNLDSLKNIFKEKLEGKFIYI